VFLSTDFGVAIALGETVILSRKTNSNLLINYHSQEVARSQIEILRLEVQNMGY
jgi:hypothetical protein